MKRSLLACAVTIWFGATALAQQQQGLSLATAQPLIPQTVTATGRVIPVISARIGARVSGHLASFEHAGDGQMLDVGMRVKTGQVLFRVNDTVFANAAAVGEAQLASAKAALENLTAPTRPERMEQLRQALAELDARVADRQREEQRYKRLVEEEKTLPLRRLEEVQTELAALVAQQQAAKARLEEADHGPTRWEVAVAQARVKEAEAALKAAKDDLRDTVVLAPFDGVITQRFKSPGDYLVNMPPTEVLELTATDRLEAELRLPEAYLSAVQAGKTHTTLVSPLLAKSQSLPISRVVPAVEAGKGTFTVRVEIPRGTCAGLVPGAFLSADVIAGQAGQGVIVPLRAIVWRGEQAAVFAVVDGKMARKEVSVGERLTESAVVRSGLAAGQKVVVGPAESMADGAPLPEYLTATK